MAQTKTPRSVKRASELRPVSEQDRIAKAMKQATAHAKRALASEGMQLPTQSWSGSAIRNPAV